MSILVQRVVIASAVAFIATAAPPLLAADPPSTVESPQCQKAKRRIVQEARRQAKGQQAIDEARAARKVCPDNSSCARYDARIRAMETRRAHHDARVARFKADAAKACKRS